MNLFKKRHVEKIEKPSNKKLSNTYRKEDGYMKMRINTPRVSYVITFLPLAMHVVFNVGSSPHWMMIDAYDNITGSMPAKRLDSYMENMLKTIERDKRMDGIFEKQCADILFRQKVLAGFDNYMEFLK